MIALLLATAFAADWSVGAGSRVEHLELRDLLDQDWEFEACDHATYLGLRRPATRCPRRTLGWAARVRSIPVDELSPFERDVYDAYVWYRNDQQHGAQEEPPPGPEAFLGVRVGPIVRPPMHQDPDDTIAALTERLENGWRPRRADVVCVLRRFDALPQVRGRWPAALAWQPVADPGPGDRCVPMPPGFARWSMQAVAGAPVDRKRDAALNRYRRFLENEVGPRAVERRSGDADDPLAAYQRAVEASLGGVVEPQQMVARAERELQAVHAEMLRLGKQTHGVDDLASLFTALRGDEHRFTKRSEIQAAADRNIARSREAVGEWLPSMPEGGCRAVRAGTGDIGSYWPAARLGDDGTFRLNLDEPEKTPTFFARPLAFHECWPGHHYQFARNAEDKSLPAFLRYRWNRGYSEGWATYAERIADEAGLYDTPLDQLGRLSYEAWRLVRVIAEVKVWTRGWGEDEVRALYAQATPVPGWQVDVEVPRILHNPGWLISHKAGQWAFLDARSRAEEALGPRFDAKAFHAVVLEAGAVPLPVMERRVDRWIAEKGVSR